MLVVRDGVGMAYMGRPFAPYLSLSGFLSRSIDLGSPMVSPGGDPVVWFFPSPIWEAESRLRVVVFCFSRPVMWYWWAIPRPGHVPSDQAPFHQAGCVSSVKAHPIISHLH